MLGSKDLVWSKDQQLGFSPIPSYSRCVNNYVVERGGIAENVINRLSCLPELVLYLPCAIAHLTLLDILYSKLLSQLYQPLLPQCSFHVLLFSALSLS